MGFALRGCLTLRVSNAVAGPAHRDRAGRLVRKCRFPLQYPGRTGFKSRKEGLYSPDRTKEIEVDGETVTIAIASKRFRTRFGDKTNAELGWAPDSSKFFLTWTDGGETGTWYVQVFEASKSGLKEIPGIERLARKDFARLVRRMPIPRTYAEEPGRGFWLAKEYCEPNVVASQWLNGSKELLISVLVPNVGICRHMSDFNVYRVEVPGGRILQRYSAKEAHQKFDPANLPLIVE